MHTGSLSLSAGGPDITAMIFHDFLYDGEPDTAAALRGVAGSVRTVKSFKYLGQIPLRDASASLLRTS